jgi:hypothetical protein
MEIEPTELKEYIKSSIDAIKGGVEGTGFVIAKPIEFNLAVMNTVEGGGGLRIYVVKAEGRLKSEEISHIKFEVHPKRETFHVNHPAVYRPNSAR